MKFFQILLLAVCSCSNLTSIAQLFKCEDLIGDLDNPGTNMMQSKKKLEFQDIAGKERINIMCFYDPTGISVMMHVVSRAGHPDEFNYVSQKVDIYFRNGTQYTQGQGLGNDNKLGQVKLNFDIGEYSVDPNLESRFFNEIESVKLYRSGISTIEFHFTNEQSAILVQTLKCMFEKVILKPKYPVLDEKYGFKDIKLDMAEKEFLRLYSTDTVTMNDSEFHAYKIKDAKYYSIGTCKISTLSWIFYKEKLFFITLVVFDKKDMDCLYETVTGLFGKPEYRTSSTKEKLVYEWNGRKVMSTLSISAARSIFVMYGKQLLKDWQAFKANKDRNRSQGNMKDF